MAWYDSGCERWLQSYSWVDISKQANHAATLFIHQGMEHVVMYGSQPPQSGIVYTPPPPPDSLAALVKYISSRQVYLGAVKRLTRAYTGDSLHSFFRVAMT